MRARITVRVTGLEGVVDYLTRVSDSLKKPEEGLHRAVNEVGKYWQRNFETEGGLNGGWAELAQSTQENRASQGYNPSYPIMLRYGALYRSSTVMFANANGPTSYSSGVPYDDRIGVTALLTFDKSSATLSLEGEQVFNHWPGRRTPRPARPIWFVDSSVTESAARGVFDWLVEEVLT